MRSLNAVLVVLLLVVLGACGASPVSVEAEAVAAPVGPPGPGWKKPDDITLRARLTPMQYEVTQHDATEPPFQNEYWDEHREGLFVDVVSGDPLFSSADKFDSGTGWPSFTKPVSPDAVTTRTDTSLFMTRVEARSRLADSHLGHVFDDGPGGSKRWCIDSAALRFVPYDRMDAEGYGAWKSAVRTGEAPLAPATDNTCAKPTAAPAAGAMTAGKPGCATTFETAILAGGCFWGMEDILREIPGVIQTDVGYIGGSTPKPTYEDVHTGLTGHAEAVRVVFDPTKLSYADLLEKWFFRMHDPTTKDRQGNDVGSQYRSAIFTTTPEQAKVAATVKAKVAASGFWKRPIVTEIEPAGTWTPAEGYHQDYLEKNPGGYTCHYMR